MAADLTVTTPEGSAGNCRKRKKDKGGTRGEKRVSLAYIWMCPNCPIVDTVSVILRIK